jgi:hypothetical protein
MEIMHEAGIVNNPRMIDIAETNFDQLPIKHGLKSLLSDTSSSRRASASPLSPAKWRSE